MKNIAIIGAVNVGIYAARAVLAAEDMRLCGFIRRQEDTVKEFINVPVATAAERLPTLPDGVIICVPSRRSAAAAKYLLGMGINTVDACDLHDELPNIRRDLHEAAVYWYTVFRSSVFPRAALWQKRSRMLNLSVFILKPTWW